MKALTEKHLAIFRRHMVDVIGIHAELTSEEIGKSELDERVLTVMREVPRHLFVPAPVAELPTRILRCLSGSIRRSHSHSWSHS